MVPDRHQVLTAGQCPKYSWPLDNVKLNRVGLLIRGFFSVNTSTAFDVRLGVWTRRADCIDYAVLHGGLEH